ASELIAKVTLYNYMKRYEKDRQGDLTRLREQIVDKINFFQSSIDESGAWYWIFQRGEQDYITTAYVYYALSLAKQNGFKVNHDALDKSGKYIYEVFSRLSNQDLESKIYLLFSLSLNQKADYSYVNRVYRNRSKLSIRGLNFLALTLHHMKRHGEAKEILRLIKKSLGELSSKSYNIKYSRTHYLDFLSSKAEVLCLSLLSTISIEKYSLKQKPFLTTLLSHLTDEKNKSSEFMAFLSQVIHRHLIFQKPSHTNFQLTVKWNDRAIFNKRITGIQPQVTIPVTKGFTSNNKLEFIVKGTGELYYSGVLSQFQPGKVNESMKKYGSITKRFNYPQYTIGAKSFNFGYKTVQLDSYVYSKQDLKDIASHRIFPVSHRIYLKSNMPESYFLLEDYIPAGSTLLQNSVSGDFQYYGRYRNKLKFYIKRKNTKARYLNISYKLVSRFRGSYRTLPPVFYPLRNRAKQISGKVLSLKIFPKPYDSFKNYRFSPDELYHLGKHYFEKQNYTLSKDFLSQVFSKYTLKDDFFKETCRMFLYISLYEKKPREVVKYFEMLKERYPSLSIPFKDVIAIADSYNTMGEQERAIQVLNGTFRSYFMQEVAISGTLSGLKKIPEAYSLMNELLLDYPDYPSVLKTYYTFGQDIYLRYTEKTENPDAKKENGLSPKMLYNMASEIFKNYLIYYPEDYNTDEVGFTLLNLYLDNKDFNNTIQNALLYSKRFSKSRFLDGYQYIGAHALFQRGDYLLAQRLSQSVAYDKFPGADGSLRDSDNKNFAILMLAKIYHQQKQFIRALDEYGKVENDFEDARRSIEFISEKKILLREVTQIKTGEKNEVELMFKGVNQVSLKLYKVNFTVLCLKEKDLTNITKINLS
ncbi:MAG: hypothetical protein OEZ36_10835, partial [Spirochaetota bacterium]|nr:hypothetical protein [Spirochaetota bacterium]